MTFQLRDTMPATGGRELETGQLGTRKVGTRKVGTGEGGWEEEGGGIRPGSGTEVSIRAANSGTTSRYAIWLSGNVAAFPAFPAFPACVQPQASRLGCEAIGLVSHARFLLVLVCMFAGPYSICSILRTLCTVLTARRVYSME